MTPGGTSVNLGHGLVLVRSLRLWNASVPSLGPQPCKEKGSSRQDVHTGSTCWQVHSVVQRFLSTPVCQGRGQVPPWGRVRRHSPCHRERAREGVSTRPVGATG